ncbi:MULTISPECIES: MBOAT family O-acyltransferase [Spirulina]|uniref:MBOAT family O-acyltransferase n=2 Tax=Spirulinaceae TaxID=1890448 RepID=UPI00232F3FA5|nr:MULTISPECIES: MBOAT family protein [Spirulina]
MLITAYPNAPMTFLDPFYALFLLALTLLYWWPRPRAARIRLWLVLLASLVVYTSLQVQYLPLLLLLTGLNFWIGKGMAIKSRPEVQSDQAHLSNEAWEAMQTLWSQRATQLLILGIVLNVACLFGFKYLLLVLNGVVAIAPSPAVEVGRSWLQNHILVPLGISFFTFENLAYLIDVYRGAPASRDFLDFASYKFFFPKLISGPITRYHPFITQFNDQTRTPKLEHFTEGLWLFAAGAVKKALIADPLGMFVDLCLGNLERAGSVDLWLVVLAYGLQLYFDFSGYVDMARGSAMFLGFTLPDNFNFPYFTTSIAQFWRRWHITLGDWLRNYLYFPLGGSRRGLVRTCINLWLILFIAGIWHIDTRGTAWGFLVWGGLHGVALVVHRLGDRYSQTHARWGQWWESVPGMVTAWVVTQGFVFLAWIFFRLPDLRQSGLMVRHLFGVAGDIQFTQKVYFEALGLGRFDLLWWMMVLVVVMALTYLVQGGLKLQLNWHLKLVLVPLCFFAVWMLAPEGGTRYIYFDF